MTIFDDIVAKRTHEIAAYFHLAEGADVSAEPPNRYRIAVAGGTVVLEVDAHLTVEIRKAREEPIGPWVSRGYHRKVPSTTLIARGHSHGNNSFVSRVEVEARRP